MIRVNDTFEELDYLKFGEMLLLNPNNKLEQPCFFIKEKDARIRELINKNYFKYEMRFFELNKVTAYLFLFIFDEDNHNIYGQWVNKYNEIDRKNYFEMNYKDNIYIALIDEKNTVRHIDIYENHFKSNIKRIFEKEDRNGPWSQKEFETELNVFNEYDSKKSFYEQVIQQQ